MGRQSVASISAAVCLCSLLVALVQAREAAQSDLLNYWDGSCKWMEWGGDDGQGNAPHCVESGFDRSLPGFAELQAFIEQRLECKDSSLSNKDMTCGKQDPSWCKSVYLTSHPTAPAVRMCVPINFSFTTLADYQTSLLLAESCTDNSLACVGARAAWLLQSGCSSAAASAASALDVSRHYCKRHTSQAACEAETGREPQPFPFGGFFKGASRRMGRISEIMVA